MSYPNIITWARAARRATARRTRAIWRLIGRMNISKRAQPTTSVPRRFQWTHSVCHWLGRYRILGKVSLSVWQIGSIGLHENPFWKAKISIFVAPKSYALNVAPSTYAMWLKLNSRYSADFTDSFGNLQTTKLGVNNNGYIPYVDYSRDYTPPPTSLTLNHTKPTHTSLSNHLIMCTSTAAPTITSASIVGITTGSITNGTYSLTRNRPFDRYNNGLPMSLSSIPNGFINNSKLTRY